MAFGFGTARVGPRTDVRYMTRFELFRSAGWFLRAGCLLGLLFVGLAYAGGQHALPAAAPLHAREVDEETVGGLAGQHGSTLSSRRLAPPS